ncbi:MAG: glutamate-5-semialdehyde dehydrogenase [Lachnospiraceae bacterium]|jgi:glutamate-5-semialdehyde dehydrogenase|nr:glutamate-5-semialdehyde dehydrogenase [Lachnospiraceae bacterium]MCI1726677.1 glutamate-5-semialdehyde dehydrogenase [Lachnospiraceae bacterium]
MLEEIGKRARDVQTAVGSLSSTCRNEVLLAASEGLLKNQEEILEANEKDMERGRSSGMAEGLLDRLALNRERLEGMALSLRQIAALPDPVGQVTEVSKRPNGLDIRKMRVPMGVIGVIYEARPNVTTDVFGLCFKSGNVTILKGGSDAVCSNAAVVRMLREVLKSRGVPEDAVQLIEDTSREAAKEFMHMDRFLDLLIPRGGAGLIETVKRESTVPVIQTGTGNCHVYVDDPADIDMAVRIIFNAKTQRISVCNAEESLIVHRNMREALLPKLEKKLKEKQVELRADPEAGEFLKDFVPASEEDWGKEYLDYILSIKTVGSLEEAIRHINRYNTKHSETIVTKDRGHAEQFMREVDAAAVYWNASTRFTDGFEFGFGAEIGISTQKLHARGPMGLQALTTEKYIIYGNGQIRS